MLSNTEVKNNLLRPIVSGAILSLCRMMGLHWRDDLPRNKDAGLDALHSRTRILFQTHNYTFMHMKLNACGRLGYFQRPHKITCCGDPALITDTLQKTL